MKKHEPNYIIKVVEACEDCSYNVWVLDVVTCEIYYSQLGLKEDIPKMVEKACDEYPFYVGIEYPEEVE